MLVKKNKAGLSQSAAEKVLSLMQEENNLDLMLRVYIQGGGCSGFQYGFSFEEQANEDDNILVKNVLAIGPLNKDFDSNDLQKFARELIHFVEESEVYVPFFLSMCDTILENVIILQNKVTLLIDSISYQYLEGATIDYKVGIDGEYFSVINPNAKTTCGCGSSFTVA